MFDIGFSELLLIGLVALLVVGPERLPKLARTAGLWLGKARNLLGSVKAEIEQEIRAEELKQIMEEQARKSGLHEIIEETKSTFDAARTHVESLDTELKELEIATPEPARDLAASAPIDPPPAADTKAVADSRP